MFTIRAINLKNTVETIILVLGFDTIRQLIRSGLYNCPTSPIRTKVEGCKSHDHFDYRVTNDLTIRFPSSSITGNHPQPIDGLIEREKFLPLCRRAVHIFYWHHRKRRPTQLWHDVTEVNHDVNETGSKYSAILIMNNCKLRISFSNTFLNLF